MPGRGFALGRQREPIEAVGRKGEQIGELADRRKQRAAAQLDRNAAGKFRKIQLDGLRRARDIGDAKDDVVIEVAQIRQNLAVLRVEETQTPASERGVAASHRQHAAHPVQQRVRIALLRLDVDRLIAV